MPDSNTSAINSPGNRIAATPEDPTSGLALWLDRAIIASLVMMAICAPHSIAATQIAWSFGLLAWAARFAVRPHPRLFRTPVDYALLGFFILTFISAIVSYDRDVSLGKLRGASLFTIVYLVAQNVRSRQILRLLALTLIASCMVNVFYTIGERIVGRGVKLSGLSAASPLYLGGVREGDTLLEVDGQFLDRPGELYDALDSTSSPAGAPVKVRVYRYEWVGDVEVPRGRLLDGSTVLDRLGARSWSRGRDWRATGFYGHFVTYGGALQLMASFAFGLFVAVPRKRSWNGWLLLIAVAGMTAALMLTVTRAFESGLMLSAFVIVLVGASRRTAVMAILCVLLISPLGLLLLRQKRNVGFFDQHDESVKWRETVYREGLHLLFSKPRHLLVGVGEDSIKRHWREWGLFDIGRIPVGHMHSNLLELALERGLPALAVWLALMFIYGRLLWRLVRSPQVDGWIERGILLGALGGLVGFLAAGIVHYNFGDSVVVMIFYFMMGLSLVVGRQATEAVRQSPAPSKS